MTEIELRVFLDVTRSFLEKLTGAPTELGRARITFEAPALNEFTGLLELSGKARGYVCITLPREFLRDLLLAVGERASGDVALADMVGEVANIVSGNARQSIGPGLHISTPTPIMGAANGPVLPTPVFIVPIHWNGHTGQIILALESA